MYHLFICLICISIIWMFLYCLWSLCRPIQG